jgi:hypothetical protein
MKAVSRCGLPLVVALLATAALGASAQAVTWTPDNTAVSGAASNPTLNYDGLNIICATGTLDGATGQDSDTIDDASVDFFGPCTMGGASASVECGDGASTVDLVARTNDPPGGTGDVALDPDFACVFTVPNVCSISLAGPQTASGGFTLDEAHRVLHFDALFAASRSGSSFCGAPQADAIVWQAQYEGWPATIDP